MPILNLSHPAILEELLEMAPFDEDVHDLLETYAKAQAAGELRSDSPKYPNLARDIYYHLTTSRNRNLITREQQAVLRRSVGAFFGMSTGSHSATTWIMESRADVIKIVDPDHISPSNLNRMRFGWDNVGEDKVDAVEVEINRISPYTRVLKTTKTDEDTTNAIFRDIPKIAFVVDAIDDLRGKIKLRLLAKTYRLPMIMATDVGDNVFLDIERYDLSPQPEIFNGRVPGIETLDLEHISMRDGIQLAMKIAGLESNSEPMLSSLLSIGRTIATWPQLGATAVIAGGVITTAIKKILLEERVNSGRYYFSLDDNIVADFNTPANINARREWIRKISERFGDNQS